MRPVTMSKAKLTLQQAQQLNELVVARIHDLTTDGINPVNAAEFVCLQMLNKILAPTTR